MRMIVYEGSVAEISQLQRELLGEAKGAALSVAVAASPPSAVSPDGKAWVSSDVAFAALTRIALSPEQRTILATIYRSHPEPVLATELQRRIKYSPSQFAGLMGAFGRRLTHTKGYVDYSWFWDQRWDHQHNCNQYRLPETVRIAVEKAGLA